MLRRSLSDIFLWLFGRRSRFLVEGESMLPTLQPGDSIFVEYGYYQAQSPQVGELVLAEHPHRSGFPIVKRVVEISELGVSIQGDNPSKSTDSRHFGPIPVESLLARVWSRL